MDKKNKEQFKNALLDATKDNIGGLDFFADFDVSKPPIGKIYEAVEAVEYRPVKRRRIYCMSFAAMAACFVVLLVSVAAGGGFSLDNFDILKGSSDKIAETAGSEATDVVVSAPPEESVEPEPADDPRESADSEFGDVQEKTENSDQDKKSQNNTADNNVAYESPHIIVSPAPPIQALPDKALPNTYLDKVQVEELPANKSAKSTNTLYGILVILAGIILLLMLFISSKVRETPIGLLYRTTILRMSAIIVSVLILAAGVYLILLS